MAKNSKEHDNDQPLKQLVGLLKEMFQLNQPDLDFGLYKIMHAKSERVQHFIEHSLPDIIRKEFSGQGSAKKKAKSQEVAVYDHLFRFFDRYYSEGDFLSSRFFTRETSSQAFPYAIPYDGNEIHLHWANWDQHYTKSAEQLMDFEFDLIKSPDLNSSLLNLETESLPVVCRLVDSDEGEHDNVKEVAKEKRTVALHQERPVILLSEGGGGAS